MPMTNYNFTSIDNPQAGRGGTAALGLNNPGQVVGFYFDGFGNKFGFLLSGGTSSTRFGPFGGGNVVASGINDTGQIVGHDDRSNVGFLFSGGNYTVLRAPNANATAATDISNSGQIVGYFSDFSGNTHGF